MSVSRVSAVRLLAASGAMLAAAIFVPAEAALSGPATFRLAAFDAGADARPPITALHAVPPFAMPLVGLFAAPAGLSSGDAAG